MMRLRLSFRLRTLFVLVTLAALALAGYSRYRHLPLLAAQEHYAALRAGYIAVRIQKPDTPEWNAHWREYAKWLKPLSMDRQSIEAALPEWQESLRHAQLRDHYLNVLHRPWLILWPSPRPWSLPPLPTDDTQLAAWWEAQLAQHVKDNMLDGPWGTSYNSAMLNRQCDILNGARGFEGAPTFNTFLRLYNIMPMDGQPLSAMAPFDVRRDA
jgi:hypothetical protein